MAKNVIKGLTVEIGGDTTKLGKALEDVNKKTSDLSGELSSINRLLKLDPGNVDLLAQKQKVLAEAINNTEEKLNTLREAEKQVQAQFEKGEVSEAQYRELQREIITTESKLKSYESAAKETADALEGVGKESSQAADNTKKLSETSKDTSEELKKVTQTLDKGVKVGLAVVTAGVAAATAALVSSVEATQEYRTAMGKLTTAFETHGHSAQVATATYEELQSVLGETDRSVEAANHLAVLTDNEEDLQKWTKICTGVFATFGDSLPIEGLTEAANETAKVGQVTGPLADALNWAGISEDNFNESLAACTDEQDRQRLIMETLTDVYSDAADKYKEVNKDVIESNKVTERMNKLWAQVGKKAAPIVNTFKKGIVELGESFVDMISDADIENFQDTIEDGFKKLSKDVIPALINALKWCKDHFNEIKSVAVGFIAALAVSKIINFATSIGTTLVGAFKGLISSLESAKSAQDLLNTSMNTNPFTILISVIGGVGVALGSYLVGEINKAREAQEDLIEKTYGLSDAEQVAADNANATADAYRNQREAMNENISGISGQFSYITSLKDELFKLADANGEVEDRERSRAEFILNELNEVLGTEYKLTQNQIENYQTLKSEIDKVIASKKSELMIAAHTDAYTEALQNRKQAEDDYYTNLRKHQETQVAAIKAEQEIEELNQQYKEEVLEAEKIRIYLKRMAKQEELEELQKILNETKTAYENSKEVIAGYYDDIGLYETAQMLILEGNTDEANKLLTDRAYYQEKYADAVGFASDEIRNTLEQEAIDAGIKAHLFRENWVNGVAGYTEEMVNEAEQSAAEAMKKMADAASDAKEVGEDLGLGLAAGIETKRGTLIEKAYSVVGSIISAFRKAADSHSPSKKMIAFGEDFDAGTEVGLETSQKDLIHTAKSQMQELLDTYNSGINGLQDNINFDRTIQNTFAIEDKNMKTVTMLDAILAAIEKGHTLVIDGKMFVGYTAKAYDESLGQRRVLSERGAL